MKRNLLLAIGITLSFHSQLQAQTIIRFTPSGAGTKDGSSWANAKSGTSLRQTLWQSSSGTEIWVAAGTYKPNTSARDSCFIIKTGLQVYGGFAGTETQRSQRNFTTNQTILSADIGVPNDSTDNTYHVVKFSDVDSTTVLDGFTIKNGNANSTAGGLSFDDMGGGILSMMYSSSPQVKNCVIRENHTERGGGGIASVSIIAGHSKMHVVDCIIENNSSTGWYGGGGVLIFCQYSNAMSEPLIERTVFKNNYAFTMSSNQTVGAGTSIISSDGANGKAVIRSCSFNSNNGHEALLISQGTTGLVDTGTQNIIVDSCTFKNNNEPIYYSASYSKDSRLSISNCSFDSNATNIWLNNIHSLVSRTTISNCSFYHSGITIQAGNGGLDTTTVNNSVFYNQPIENAASDGGKSVLNLNNVTMFADSTASVSGNFVHGMVRTSAQNTPTNPYGPASAYNYINNSIIWNDWPSWMAVFGNSIGVGATGTGATANGYVKNSIVYLVNNTWPVKGQPSVQESYGVDMGGNSGSNPLFRNQATGDLRLKCNSPAINTGNNALVPSGITKTLDGMNRIMGGNVDKGAYEADTVGPKSIPQATVAGSTLSCTAGYTVYPDSVKWTFGDGQTGTSFNPVHNYTNPGNYTICLHVYTACGSADSCFQMTILPSSVSGINNDNERVWVYPNPVIDQLFIEGVQPSATAQLITITGNVVQSLSLPVGSKRVDVSGLASGIYLLELTTELGERKVVRVVKE